MNQKFAANKKSKINKDFDKMKSNVAYLVPDLSLEIHKKIYEGFEYIEEITESEAELMCQIYDIHVKINKLQNKFSHAQNMKTYLAKETEKYNEEIKIIEAKISYQINDLVESQIRLLERIGEIEAQIK